MPRNLTPTEAVVLGRRAGRSRRSSRLIRMLEAWTEQDAPHIADLPGTPQRVIPALRRALEAAEKDGQS